MIRNITITLNMYRSTSYDKFFFLKTEFENRTGLHLSDYHHSEMIDGDIHAYIYSTSLWDKQVIFHIMKVCGNGNFHWKATW